MFGSFKILTVRGIPIRVHFTLLIILPWFAMTYGKAMGVSTFWGWVTSIGLFTSVALHELGHLFVAMAKGIRANQIVLTPIGGIAMLTRLPARARDEFWIAIAGPLVSLALGAFLWIAATFSAPLLSDSPRLVLFWVGALNLILGLFNLLPCFPMDGGRIFRALMTTRWGRLEATRRAVKLGTWFAAAFFVWGLYIMNPLTMLLAWFVYSSARAEYRMVQMQETAHRMNPLDSIFRSRPSSDNQVEISVSPPPYRRE